MRIYKSISISPTAQVNGSPEDAGIIPRAVTDLFERMDKLRKEGVKASVHASFLEVGVYLGVLLRRPRDARELPPAGVTCLPRRARPAPAAPPLQPPHRRPTSACCSPFFTASSPTHTLLAPNRRPYLCTYVLFLCSVGSFILGVERR